MGHPDFRVGGKIFATLGPNADVGMVKLNLDQQRWLVSTALSLSDDVSLARRFNAG